MKNSNHDNNYNGIVKRSDGHEYLSYLMLPVPFEHSDSKWENCHPLVSKMGLSLQKQGCIHVVKGNKSILFLILFHKPKIDAVHVHWPDQIYNSASSSIPFIKLIKRILQALHLLSWVVACKIVKIKFIWTIHDLYPHPQTPCNYNPLDRLVRILLMRWSHAIILNEATAQSYVEQEFGKPKRVFIAPLGNYRSFYPSSSSYNKARYVFNIKPENRVFLFFGSAHKNRNPVDLIIAFKLLANKYLRLLLAVTWDTDDLKEEIIAAAAEDDRIHLHFGMISPAKAEEYYSASDIVVVPGEYYLTSAVIVAALSFHKPVIADNFGCAPGQIKDAGFLYNSHEQGALCKAIKLAAECDIVEYRRRAEIVANKLSWDDFAKNTASAYRS